MCLKACGPKASEQGCPTSLPSSEAASFQYPNRSGRRQAHVEATHRRRHASTAPRCHKTADAAASGAGALFAALFEQRL